VSDMTIEEIKEYLPHRHPFLLIDRIIAFEKDTRITAIKNVTVNEPFLPGHFPGNPVFPGVLQLEALAQAGAIAVLSDERYAESVDLFTPEEMEALVDPSAAELAREAWRTNPVRVGYANADGTDEVNRRLRADFATTLVDEMLTKVDRMTMAAGLEARVPFLDRGLVEWAFRLPGRACAAEVDLSVIETAAAALGPVEAPVISPYPVATQDVALVVAASVPAAEVEAALSAGAAGAGDGSLLEEVRLFDVYTGAQAGEGNKSLAYTLRFRAPDRTLTDEEVTAARDAAVAEAGRRVGAVLRGAS